MAPLRIIVTGAVLLVSMTQFLVQGQVLGKGRCPQMEVQRDFDPEKFMGTWYEIERFYVDFEASGKCTKVEYASTPDGRVGVITTALDIKSGRPLVSYGLATFESGDLAKMSLRLSRRPSTPEPEEFPYNVIDTDYSSYAVVASCQELCRGEKHAVMAWIMGRAGAISQDTLDGIYKKLNAIDGLDTRKFMKVDQSECVNVAVALRSDDPNFRFSRDRARNFLSGLANLAFFNRR